MSGWRSRLCGRPISRPRAVTTDGDEGGIGARSARRSVHDTNAAPAGIELLIRDRQIQIACLPSSYALRVAIRCIHYARIHRSAREALSRSAQRPRGAWSLGLSFLRGRLVDAASARVSRSAGADEDVVNAQPWFLRKARLRSHQLQLSPADQRAGRASTKPSATRRWNWARSSGVQWIWTCPGDRVIDVAVFRA